MNDDAVLLSLEQDSKESAYLQLRTAIAAALVNSQIRPGEKISSIRGVALKLGITQAAVRKAYDQLTAEGWLEVRQGAGTFVSQSSPLLARQSLQTEAGKTHGDLSNQTEQGAFQPLSPSDWTGPFSAQTIGKFTDASPADDFRRQMIEAGRQPLSEPCSGAKFESALDAWVKDCQTKPLSLGDPAGLADLREYICRWLNQSRGMSCKPANVIIMNNLAECRSLVARLFLQSGTRIMVEDPSVNALWMQAHKAHPIPVAVDDSGLIPEEMDTVVDVRMAYVTPSSQLPTGAVLSRPRRQKLLHWADRNHALIIEDDSNCEFTYESRVIPAIHAMDQSDRTLYMGSLEITFPAQMQLAFVVVPQAVRAPWLRLKSIANRCTSPLLQGLVFRLFEGEYVQERLRKLQRLLEQRRATLLAELALVDQSNIFYSPTKSGTRQSVWLTPAFDDIYTANQCLQKEVLPISPFYLTHAGRPGLVLSFALDNNDIVSYMRQLKTVLIAPTSPGVFP